MKCSMSRLSSKLVGGEKECFGQMCVDAVMHLDQDLLDPRMIGVKKVMGGELFFTIIILAHVLYVFPHIRMGNWTDVVFFFNCRVHA